MQCTSLKMAQTRSPNRLWDCLLNFLQSETSIRYPDPFFQTNVDLSQISYLATANSVAGLIPPRAVGGTLGSASAGPH